MSWLTLALLALLGPNAPVFCHLQVPKSAPLGFNSFDHYPPFSLNTSVVIQLAQHIKDQLHPVGFEFLTIDGGWSQSPLHSGEGRKSVQHLDGYGRPIPAPERYANMPLLAKNLRDMGLQLGLWVIRGVHIDAVKRKLPVKGMPQYTINELVDIRPVGGGPNGSCLWDKEWLGVNRSHPAAQAYYDSQVENLVNLGADFIKADCMMCAPCYTDEMEMFTEAVKRSPHNITLSYSPGGGNTPQDGLWVAANTIGSMYRITTDFHGGWYGWGGLQQLLFIAGNFSAARLNGANGTWPDNDMIPIGPDWWGKSTEQDDRGQTIMTLDMISKAPLMYAGRLPADQKTLSYFSNQEALAVRSSSVDPHVIYYEGNCTCKGGKTGSCTLLQPMMGPPCVSTWKATYPKPGELAVAIFNMAEHAATVVTKFSQLGLQGSGKYKVSSLWGKTTSVHESSFTTHLRKHASVLLIVSKYT